MGKTRQNYNPFVPKNIQKPKQQQANPKLPHTFQQVQPIRQISTDNKMKNHYANKILPLTIKELKKAELEYRSRKNQVYDSASYEFVTIVARVIKVTAMEIKLTDQTDILEIQLFPTALKKAVDPSVGKYYRFSFTPRRNVINGNSADVFAFEIIGLMKISPNEITIHLLTCIQQKMGRESFSPMTKTKEQTTKAQIPSTQHSNSTYNSLKEARQNSLPGKKPSGEFEISKYCRDLGREFDVDSIVKHFKEKYSVKEVEKVMETLSDKGFVMDLGLVYEWVGDEE